MKIPKELKTYVTECVKKAAWCAEVTHFQISVHYMEKDEDTKDRDSDVLASMSVDRRYLLGILRIYPALIKKWKNKDGKYILRHTVFHEVAHLVTQHMMEIATACYKDEGETKDAWESLTERVARMTLMIDDAQKS